MNEHQTIEQVYNDIEHGIYFSTLLLFFDAIALFLALLYDQQSLVIFTLILLILGLLLRIWSRLSPNGLDFSSITDRARLFPGEETKLTIFLNNRKLLPVILKLKLTVSGVFSPDRPEAAIEENNGLLWFQQLTIRRSLKLQKRGVYKTGSPRMITGDFFGFFPRLKLIADDTHIIVYPRLVPIKPFPILKRIMFGKPAFASPVQDPIYLLGTRDYRDLSPARNIHWKASARHSRLQEKIFEPTEQEKILLILEADGFCEDGSADLFEKTIEVIASLAVVLNSNHHAVGFLSNCSTIDEIPACLAIKRGVGHISNLLEILARIDRKPAENLDRLLQDKQSFPVGLSCLYFSCNRGKELELLHQQRIPATNIAARAKDRSASADVIDSAGVRFCRLDDICLKG